MELSSNIYLNKTSLVAQTVKRLPAMWETRVRFLDREDPLEKEMAIHSSTLVWKIPWTEEPDRLQSMGSQRVRHDWATSLSLSVCFSLLIRNQWVLVHLCSTVILCSLFIVFHSYEETHRFTSHRGEIFSHLPFPGTYFSYCRWLTSSESGFFF